MASGTANTAELDSTVIVASGIAITVASGSATTAASGMLHHCGVSF